MIQSIHLTSRSMEANWNCNNSAPELRGHEFPRPIQTKVINNVDTPLGSYKELILSDRIE
jgi:hypothetical protein